MTDEAKIALLKEIIDSDFDGNAAAFSRHRVINKGLVWRALKKGYIAPALSRAMGWPTTAPAPVCPDCNEVHTVPWCVIKDGPPVKPNGRKSGKPRQEPPYFKCRRDNPEQAARQVEKYLPGYRLVKEGTNDS